MLRSVFLAAPLVLASFALPAAAPAQSGASSNVQCEQRNDRRRQRGAAIGGIARGMLGRIAPGGGIANVVIPMGNMLSDAILSLLDCDEQEKAATATEEAVRGGVGTTTSWSSESRPGVTGSSTVTAVEQESGGGDCMTVTDIVIVDGEETRAPKRMCRRPPSTRYVRV